MDLANKDMKNKIKIGFNYNMAILVTIGATDLSIFSARTQRLDSRILKCDLYIYNSEGWWIHDFLLWFSS